MPSFYYYKGGIMPIIKSTLYLCSGVPLDPNYSYTMDFDNLQAQTSYFDSKINNVLQENEDYSYIRDSEDIKVQANIDDLLGVNYLFYENADKRYYAFITKKEYVNPTTTRIKFDIDVMQTFMFNYTLNECFVEREHQDRYDSQGKPIFNLEKENLDYGTHYEQTQILPLKQNNIFIDAGTWGEEWREGYVIICSTNKLNGDTISDINLRGNFIAPQYYMYALPFVIKTRTTYASGETENVYCPSVNHELYIKNGGEDAKLAVAMGDVLNSTELKASNIISIYVTPYISGVTITQYNGTNVPQFNTNNGTTLKLTLAEDSQTTDVPVIRVVTHSKAEYAVKIGKIGSVNTNIEDTTNPVSNIAYEPKLWCYPYKFIKIDNRQTEPLIIKYELTNPDNSYNIKLYYEGIESPQPKHQFKLKNYASNSNQPNLDNVMIDNSITDLPLSTNAYQEYLTQNKASATTGLALNIAQSVLGFGIGVATGGVGFAIGAGQALGVAGNIANQLIKIDDLKQTPDSIRNVGNNGLFTLLNEFGINQIFYSVPQAILVKLSGYFMHYGYLCNNFKTPNLKSRYYYNYIKTIGATLNTNIDSEWAEKIKQVYDNGVTIWHYRDASTFKGTNNYGYNNVEINLLGGNNG